METTHADSAATDLFASGGWYGGVIAQGHRLHGTGNVRDVNAHICVDNVV